MSLDNSLKQTNKLARHRNVLTRTEKIERLRKEGKFDMQKGDPLNLPKVGNRKVTSAKK